MVSILYRCHLMQLTYFACRCVQPSNILGCDDVHQTSALHMPYLNKARLKSKNIGIEDSESLWSALPCNLPVGSRSPAVAVDEE
jgi:hypothetical protein